MRPTWLIFIVSALVLALPAFAQQRERRLEPPVVRVWLADIQVQPDSPRADAVIRDREGEAPARTSACVSLSRPLAPGPNPRTATWATAATEIF